MQGIRLTLLGIVTFKDSYVVFTVSSYVGNPVLELPPPCIIYWYSMNSLFEELKLNNLLKDFNYSFVHVVTVRS